MALTRHVAGEQRIDDIVTRIDVLLYRLLYLPDGFEAFEDAEERLLRVLELAEDAARQIVTK